MPKQEYEQNPAADAAISPEETGSPSSGAPARRKKRGGLTAFLILFILAAALGGGVIGGRYVQSLDDRWQDDLEPVAATGGQEFIFTVEKGWTLSRTAQALEDNQLIRSAESFVRLGKQEGQAESLKAGRYLLSPSMSSPDILDELVKGSLLTAKFTIPEGFTLRQIAKVFAEKGIASENEFWQCVKTGAFDYDFLEGLPADEYRLEGYLFPDTYIIELDEPLESVLNRMLKRYQEIWQALPPRQTGLSDRETLILASIVQNEVKLDEERPIAAGIFCNRLETNMLLQSCSTVQYYFEEPKYPLLTVDTQIDFPYNTYIYQGLPPGPVGAPGKISLEAAATPADTEYFYFVARDDGSGGHYFSKTLSEHNRAVAQAKANRG
jgi:UPF0755 protein